MLAAFLAKTKIRAAAQINNPWLVDEFLPKTDSKIGIKAATPAKSNKDRSRTDKATQTPRFLSSGLSRLYIRFIFISISLFQWHFSFCMQR
jgi:hypothetical protein